MTTQASRKFTRTDFLIIAVFSAIMLTPIGYIILLNIRAHREYIAYEELQRHGVTGDDWVSLSELFTGKPIVVQLYIPKTVPRDIAFKYLPDMVNVDSIEMEYENLTPEELKILSRLPVWW